MGIRLHREAVPPVSVARVCYARRGMFPTKLTSPRLDALASLPQKRVAWNRVLSKCCGYPRGNDANEPPLLLPAAPPDKYIRIHFGHFQASPVRRFVFSKKSRVWVRCGGAPRSTLRCVYLFFVMECHLVPWPGVLPRIVSG